MQPEQKIHQTGFEYKSIKAHKKRTGYEIIWKYKILCAVS